MMCWNWGLEREMMERQFGDWLLDRSGPRWVVTHVHSICIFFMCCCKHDGFIQSLEKHTVSTYYVPGAVLGDTVLGLNDGPILV